jgi:hypothetical protein
MAFSSSAHVAGPLVAPELIGSTWDEARDVATHPNCRIGERHPGEQQDVDSALAK